MSERCAYALLFARRNGLCARGLRLTVHALGEDRCALRAQGPQLVFEEFDRLARRRGKLLTDIAVILLGRRTDAPCAVATHLVRHPYVWGGYVCARCGWSRGAHDLGTRTLPRIMGKGYRDELDEIEQRRLPHRTWRNADDVSD